MLDSANQKSKQTSHNCTT